MIISYGAVGCASRHKKNNIDFDHMWKSTGQGRSGSKVIYWKYWQNTQDTVVHILSGFINQTAWKINISYLEIILWSVICNRNPEWTNTNAMKHQIQESGIFTVSEVVTLWWLMKFTQSDITFFIQFHMLVFDLYEVPGPVSDHSANTLKVLHLNFHRICPISASW